MRTQIILDEMTHRAVRSLAFRRHQSMSQTIREILRKSLEIETPAKKPPKHFSFVGLAASGKKNSTSEKHDQVLGEGEW